jgi:hypothetical protein
MSLPKCSCSSFDHLEGASVPAYTKAFLEQADETYAMPGKNLFRCRACGSLWEKHAPDEKRARASIVRLRPGVD